MSANVVCTGRRYDDPDHPGRYQLTTCTTGPGPRPWKGEWGRSWPDSWRNGYGWQKFVIAKPCPRCGGTVALIGHTQEVER